MLTFSQAIDAIIAEVIRPDLDLAMANYLNATIRELHFTADSSNPLPVGYASNLVEDVIYADAETGFTWTIERPRRFQLMEAVWYEAAGRYATPRKPSTMKAFESSVDGAEFSYYRSGDVFAFQNYGGIDAPIGIAYFEYLPGLKYYAESDRPAVWDEEEEEFTFHADYSATPELQQKALDLTTNWMLQRWNDLLLAGIRAKTWARLADEVRMRTAYSTYQNTRPQIIAAETYNLTPRFRK